MRPSLLPNLIAAVGPQHGARLCRPGAVRGRAGLWRRPAARTSGIDAAGRAPRHERPAPLGGARAGRSISSTPRRTRSRVLGVDRRSARQAADGRRRARLVSSGPRRLADARAEEPARDLRRDSSARARRDGCRRRRSSPSRSTSTRFRCRRARAPPARRSTPPTFRRSRAISPSSWRATWRPTGSSAPREGADKALIGDVSVFDVFAGEAIGEGRKSVAIEVTLQPRERTLTEEEIEKVSAPSSRR